MMMMRRVMCVLAVVLCCPCGYTMTAAAATTTAGQPKAVMANSVYSISDTAQILFVNFDHDKASYRKDCANNSAALINGKKCSEVLKSLEAKPSPPPGNNVQPGSHNNPGQQTREDGGDTTIEGQGDRNLGTQEGASKDASSPPESARNNRETVTDATTAQSQNQESSTASQVNQGTPSNTSDNNTTPGNSNSNQQPSSAGASATAASESQENNSTTPSSHENTTTEAPTTTPSPAPVPVTDSQISNIASTVHKNKANVDSSVSPVWMRTAAPLLIVAVLFSVTVY
ncbi:uncharacterized protein TM35_000103000 [Trypanosoma theileri]|uniref:Mucin TcMUCII n=1 Tax=Trypanosoma theileri TaxID=67003 RepID=A0A1X0NZB8_9TRYP|nr:uncharacterized protein TM35_000103000 [Trypanosoma theileri]ORC90032.1 hypothetical protein TM35_000103000 [Trypanosoma theileri]